MFFFDAIIPKFCRDHSLLIHTEVRREDRLRCQGSSQHVLPVAKIKITKTFFACENRYVQAVSLYPLRFLPHSLCVVVIKNLLGILQAGLRSQLEHFNELAPTIEATQQGMQLTIYITLVNRQISWTNLFCYTLYCGDIQEMVRFMLKLGRSPYFQN